MTTTRKQVWFALVMASLAGCSSASTTPRVCTAEFVYGISVRVRDSVSGAPTASGATLVARDGSYADSVRAVGGLDADAIPLSVAGERAGIYSLTLRKAGFGDWTLQGVRVERGECHVVPVALTALLQRLR